MKPETKIKALMAISEATSKLSIAINEGRYSKIEFILNNLKHDLTTIRMSEKVFPSGGVHSTATELALDRSVVDKFISAKANDGMEEVLNKYQKGESEESFRERVDIAKLSPEFIETVAKLRRIAEVINTEEETGILSFMGHYELFFSENTDNYFFRLKAYNGQVILYSEGYKTKTGAENGIKSVKKNAQKEERFVICGALNDHYFLLHAQNGQVIGTSEMYSSETAAINGIKSVQKNSVGPIKDLT